MSLGRAPPRPYIEEDDDELDNIRVMGLVAPVGRGAEMETEKKIPNQGEDISTPHTTPEYTEIPVRKLVSAHKHISDGPSLHHNLHNCDHHAGSCNCQPHVKASQEADPDLSSAPIRPMSLDEAYEHVRQNQTEVVTRLRRAAEATQGKDYIVPGRVSVAERVLAIRAKRLQAERLKEAQNQREGDYIEETRVIVEETTDPDAPITDLRFSPNAPSESDYAPTSVPTNVPRVQDDGDENEDTDAPEEDGDSTDDYDADWDFSDSDDDVSVRRDRERLTRRTHRSDGRESTRIPPLMLHGGGGIRHTPGPLEALLEKELTRPLARALVKARIGAYSVLFIIVALAILAFNLAASIAASLLYREMLTTLKHITIPSFSATSITNSGFSVTFLILAWPALLLARMNASDWVLDWVLPFILVLILFAQLTLRSVLRSVSAGHISFFTAERPSIQVVTATTEDSESAELAGHEAHSRTITIGTDTGSSVAGDSIGLSSHSTPQQSRIHIEAALNLGLTIILLTHILTPLIVYVPYLAQSWIARTFVSLIFPCLGVSTVSTIFTRALNPKLKLAAPFFSPFVAGLVSMVYVMGTGLLQSEAVRGERDASLAICLLAGGLLFGSLLECFHYMTQCEATLDEIHSLLVAKEATLPERYRNDNVQLEPPQDLLGALVSTAFDRTFWSRFFQSPAQLFTINAWALRDLNFADILPGGTPTSEPTEASDETSRSFAFASLPASVIYNRLVRNWAALLVQATVPLCLLSISMLVGPSIFALITRRQVAVELSQILNHQHDRTIATVIAGMYPDFEGWVEYIYFLRGYVGDGHLSVPYPATNPLLYLREQIFVATLILLVTNALAFITITVFGGNLYLIGAFSADLQVQERVSVGLEPEVEIRRIEIVDGSARVSSVQTALQPISSEQSHRDSIESSEQQSFEESLAYKELEGREAFIKSRVKQPPDTIAKSWLFSLLFQIMTIICAILWWKVELAWYLGLVLPISLCSWVLPKRGLRLYSRMFFE